MRQDVPEGWRIFTVEELHCFYSSDTRKVIKPRRSETGEAWKR